VLDQLLHTLSGLSGDPKLLLLLKLKVQLCRGKALLEKGKLSKVTLLPSLCVVSKRKKQAKKKKKRKEREKER